MIRKAVFEEVTEYQARLMKPIPPGLSEECIARFRELALALNQEVAELIDSVPWKPWRDISDQSYDYENLKREIVDCIFFLIEISELFGITCQELFDKYDEVMLNNHKRLENGYSKVRGGAVDENVNM
jgi:NTP pyrophosphatase (non-canonical NTP hydrolase)